MRTFAVLFIAASSLLDCADPNGPTTSGAGGATSSTGSQSGTSTTSTGTTQASSTATTVSGTSSAGGNASPPGPNPPLGYTMCGSGTFTQGDAHDACMNIGSGPKDCEAVTITDGSWQAWCDPAELHVYVWAELNGAAQTAAVGCVPRFESGAFEAFPGGAGLGGDSHQVQFPEVSPNASYEYTLSFGSASPSGTATFAARANLAILEGANNCNYADPNAVVVTAFAMTWQ